MQPIQKFGLSFKNCDFQATRFLGFVLRFLVVTGRIRYRILPSPVLLVPGTCYMNGWRTGVIYLEWTQVQRGEHSSSGLLRLLWELLQHILFKTDATSFHCKISVPLQSLIYLPCFLKSFLKKIWRVKKSILKQLQSALACLSIYLYMFTDAFFASISK